MDDCPYGAEDCPKLNSFKEMLLENRNEVKELNKNVIKLSTTYKNVAYAFSILVAILTALIGAVVL